VVNWFADVKNLDESFQSESLAPHGLAVPPFFFFVVDSDSSFDLAFRVVGTVGPIGHLVGNIRFGGRILEWVLKLGERTWLI
jgi:hypothetical protein